MKNYVAYVNVYSPSTGIIMTKRDKAVSFFDQLGTVGGTFGLFVGTSLLSFAEVVIFIVSAIFYATQIRKNPFDHGKTFDQEKLDRLCSVTKVSMSDMPIPNMIIMMLFLMQMLRQVKYFFKVFPIDGK